MYYILITAYLTICILTKYIDIWDISTRTVSTANAVRCIYISVYSLLYYYQKMWDFNWQGDDLIIKYLYGFSSYLLIDGIFSVIKVNKISITNIIHHIVGGYGIYLIVTRRLGLGFGIYFCFTELSTPFLNISWFLYNSNNRYKYLCFFIFYTTLGRLFNDILWIVYSDCIKLRLVFNDQHKSYKYD